MGNSVTLMQAGTKKGAVARSIDYAPDAAAARPSVDGACIDGLDWDGSPSSAVHPIRAATPYMVHCMRIRLLEPSGHLSLFLSHLQVISLPISLQILISWTSHIGLVQFLKFLVFGHRSIFVFI
jgi:hypothetical protein